MQTDQILSAPLLDIIFEGRNKDYGAYELRATYHRRIRKALLVTGTITVLVFSGVVLANSLPKDEARYKIGPEVTIQDLADEKPQEKLPEPERQRDPEPPVQTVDYTEPVITENPETPPPTQDQIAVSLVDTVTRSGVIDDGRPDPSLDDIGGKTGILDDKVTKDVGPAENVDIDAKFDGNWKRFLETNLNGEVPVNNSAPAGRYSVVIRFVVDVDGSTSEVTALTAHGYGLEQEAIRVIKKSKKWEPAFLNGVHVKAYKKQVIVFEVVDE
jgi:periplasmic protein TonB